MDGVDGFLQAKNYSRDGGRSPNLWVVHDEEYPERPDAAWAVAQYFAGANAPQASAHACVDDRNAIGCVDWRDVAWHSGHGGTNARSIGIEHSGYASQSREEWLDDYGMKMLDRSARLFAEVGHGMFGIPAVKLSPEQVAAGEAGICGHADVTYGFNIYGGHTDPGGQFPWDVYLDMCHRHIGGGKRKKMYSYTRKGDLIVQFCAVFGQVAHRWQPKANGGFTDWSMLNDGQPFPVDSVDATTNADGRMEIVAWDSATGQTCYRTQNADTTWRPWRV